MKLEHLPIEIPEGERTALVNWLVNKRRRAARDNLKAAGENCCLNKKVESRVSASSMSSTAEFNSRTASGN